MRPSQFDTDILIVGAGPAGAALALALAPRLRVMMAGRLPSRWQVGETLPGAARALLRDLGHLAAFEAEGHRPSLGRMSVWGSLEMQQFDGFRDPHGPGWQLDRSRFDAGLIDAAVSRGCRFVRSGLLRDLKPENAGWRVQFADGLQVTCRFVVDATGRRAALARRLGARQIRLDNLISVFARLQQPKPSALDGFSTVIAAIDGWWYRTALPTNECLVAFHTDRDLAIAESQPPGSSGITAPLETARAAAWSGRLSEFAGPGWAAVGDAGCSFDPLSSQGLFNALHGAIRLAQAIEVGCDTRGYVAGLERAWNHFLHHRRDYYSAERRWNSAPFWQRRQQH